MSAMLVDGGGAGVLPTPADLPAVDTDAALLLESAEALRRVGGRLQSATESTSSTWDGFRDLLVAPWAEPLHSQLRPVVGHSNDTAAAMVAAGHALAEFAATVRVLKVERESLEQRILAAQAGGLGMDSDEAWQADALRADTAAFARRVTAAEETCIDALQGAGHGAYPYVPRTRAEIGMPDWERCTGIPRYDGRGDQPTALVVDRLGPVTDLDRCTDMPLANGPGGGGRQPTFLGTDVWNDWPRCTGYPTPEPRVATTSFTTGPPCPRP